MDLSMRWYLIDSDMELFKKCKTREEMKKLAVSRNIDPKILDVYFPVEKKAPVEVLPAQKAETPVDDLLDPEPVKKHGKR